jgi:dethiobiotin synthetase
MAQTHEAFLRLRARHQCVLVEGVGGLFAPVAQRGEQILTCLDIVSEWQLPAVLVARRTLGTINHTLLSCRMLEARGQELAGLVFCDADAVPAGDVAAQTSPALIAEMLGVQPWGQVPHLTDLSRAALERAAQELHPHW